MSLWPIVIICKLERTSIEKEEQIMKHIDVRECRKEPIFLRWTMLIYGRDPPDQGKKKLQLFLELKFLRKKEKKKRKSERPKKLKDSMNSKIFSTISQFKTQVKAKVRHLKKMKMKSLRIIMSQQLRKKVMLWKRAWNKSANKSRKVSLNLLMNAWWLWIPGLKNDHL